MDNIEHENMIPSRRQEYILELIRRRKAVSVAQLSQELFINEATIRRDLNVLAKSGAISRTYGGAVLNEGLDSEIPFFVRETSHADAKRQIGECAAEFIKDGDTIFIDSSSTAAFLIPRLASKKGLRIVTNGAKAVLMLSKLTDCEIYCVGGKLRENSLSFIGSETIGTLKNFHFDAAFFSCRGVDLRFGLTDSNINEAEMRRILIGNSKKSYLLADDSKFDVVSFYAIAELSAVTAVVTNLRPKREWEERLKQAGVAVYL